MAVEDIAGKWAVVTGAASGMGKTTALELARQGTNLILVDICSEPLEEAARDCGRLGVSTEQFCVDLTSWEEVQELASTVFSAHGPVDILVNCVGIAHMAYILNTSIEEWQRLIGVNLWTIIYMVKAFAPAMIERGSGHIVNISSGQAFFAVPTWGAYAATKFAVDGYTEALYYELAGRGVHVACVYPGVVRTPFYENIKGGKLTDLGMRLVMGTVAVKPEAMSRLIVKGIRGRKPKIMQWFVWPVYILRHVMPWPFEVAGLIGARLLRSEHGSGSSPEDGS